MSYCQILCDKIIQNQTLRLFHQHKDQIIIECFEVKKLAFARLKEAPLGTEEASSPTPESGEEQQSPSQFPLRFRGIADTFNKN